MNNFRNVNNDILKEWFLFREDEIASLTCEEDKHHWVYFDEISQKILRNVPDKNKKTGGIKNGIIRFINIKFKHWI